MKKPGLNHSLKQYLVGVLVIAALLLAISKSTLVLLSLPNVATPFSVFVVLSHGVYFEALVSSAGILLPMATLSLWVLGGALRVIALYIGALLMGCLLSVLIGLIVFVSLMGRPDLNLLDILELVHHFDKSSLERDYFLCTQFGSMATVIVITMLIYFKNNRPANKTLGDAHFATGIEIQKAGFFQKREESIIIGKKYGAPLYANGFEHVLVFAPSGSGKTRSIAIPNLFHYPSSIVCNDVKFDLFTTTSQFRQRVLGHECYCFAPARADGVTHRYNPLTFISSNPLQRMTDIQRIGHIFIPDGKDPFWAQTGRKLFKALVLFLLDTPSRPTTFGELNRLVKQFNFDAWLKSILDNTDGYDPEFYRNGYSYINNEDRTRNNILESFSGHFELFDDPIIDAATSASDFDFGDLRRKKMTIYVGFTDEDMERLSPLLTLFWQQLISRMIKAIPDKKEEPFPVLCLIDEFSSLGRIERLRRSLKLLREYRVRCVLMFQYIAQTYERYSHDEARAFTNIKTKVAYTTEDLNDAEFISKMLGVRTKRVVSISTSNQGQGMSSSKSINVQAIPLLRPESVMKLSPSVSLIIRSGVAPIKARQFIWYKERVMKALPEGHTLVPKQTPKQVPFDRPKIDERNKKIYQAESEEFDKNHNSTMHTLV